MVARRHSSSWLGIALAAIAFAPSALRAQQTPPPAVAAPYQAPTIALVQPPDGGSVPQDKPVVVFRFAPGEADDPLDLRSFAVAVDGQDRSALFQVTATAAWGPLAAPANGAAAATGLSPGPHQVAARICSSRGACREVSVTVTVAAPPVADPTSPASKHGFLALLISVVRRLLAP